jgi:hypothetical protein
MPSPRFSRRRDTAVTERCATTYRRMMAPCPRRGKSWVLAMLAPKRGLRVAPVPPRAADLTRPACVRRDNGRTASRFPIAVAQRLDIRLTIPGGGTAHPVLAILEGTARQTGIVLVAGAGTVLRIPDMAARPSPALSLDLERSLRAVSWRTVQSPPYPRGG